MKEISIQCGGEIYIDIDDMTFFQGDLKSISDNDFNDLKKSIIKSGITLSFHIWKHDDVNDILDGHHRYLALKALRSEGYFVPQMPCNTVKAKNKKDAASKVLTYNTRYAKMTQESISDFMILNGLNVADMEFLNIPELNMDDFKQEEENDNTSAATGISEKKCPECGFDLNS